MASYAVSATERGAYEKTLAANTEDTVTFGQDVAVVEVKVLSGGVVYFTTDGSAAAVKGATCLDAQPGTVVQVEPETPGPTVVRLISSAPGVYSVNAA